MPLSPGGRPCYYTDRKYLPVERRWRVDGSQQKASIAAAANEAEELLSQGQAIYSVNFEVMPLLMVCSIWYLFLTTVLTLIQGRIENHFGKGFGSEGVKQAKTRKAKAANAGHAGVAAGGFTK